MRALAGVLVAVLAWSLPQAVFAQTASPVKRHAVYMGRTSQGQACTDGETLDVVCNATFHISPRASTVRRLEIRYVAPCADDRTFVRSSTIIRGYPIPQAKIDETASYAEELGDTASQVATETMHAAFRRSARGRYVLTGEFRIRTRVTFPDRTTTVCQSGPVSFAARPEAPHGPG
jgi:hypothetical protein